MYKQKIVMCALCKAIKNGHEFVNMNLKHTKQLNSQTNTSILYDICPQCQTSLQTGKPVIQRR
jgi:hypothetical protein